MNTVGAKSLDNLIANFELPYVKTKGACNFRGFLYFFDPLQHYVTEKFCLVFYKSKSQSLL